MKKIGSVLILLFLIPIKVNALTGNINLDCNPINAKANTNIICNVSATSDEEISGLSANVSLSSNLEFVSFQTDSSWQGDGTGNKIGLYTAENKKGTFNLGILTIKVGDNTFDANETIALTNCIYSNANFEKINITNTSINIRIPSSNNRLASLEVLPSTINFNPDTLDYSITVDSPSVSITAVKEDSKSTISGDIGDKNLNYGLNIFKIYVTSEGKDIRTYTINITRKDNRSTENRLSSLTISGNKFNFNENIYTYNLNVSYETSSIKIGANLKDSKSSFVKGYEPGIKNLKEGLNKIEIKVMAENGSIKTYSINVTRSEDPDNKSDDNYLTDIELDNGNIDFSKEQEEYKLSVSYDTDSIKIDAVASSSKSKVEIIGNDHLQVGENVVIIKVTAGNGSVREYKIIVTKKDKDEVLSSNNYLKLLKIDNYDIDFKKEVFDYNIKIEDEEELNIVALSEDSNANVKILENEKLKKGSIIRIVVTAEDGSTREYKIKINKKVQINYLLITVIIETIIILGVVIYLIIRKKGNNNHEEI